MNITIPPTKIATSQGKNRFRETKQIFYIETKFTPPKMSSRPNCNSTIFPDQKWGPAPTAIQLSLSWKQNYFFQNHSKFRENNQNH